MLDDYSIDVYAESFYILEYYCFCMNGTELSMDSSKKGQYNIMSSTMCRVYPGRVDGKYIQVNVYEYHRQYTMIESIVHHPPSNNNLKRYKSGGYLKSIH